LAVRALVAAGAVERGLPSSRSLHSTHCKHCASDPASPPTASLHVNDVHASCCGFPKNLNKGPSTVLDQGVFGDDACFIAQYGSTHVVGVADGVGGWRNYGIDPSEFSSRLMKLCEKIVKKGEFEPARPDKLLARAYETLVESPRATGSSTACVLVVHHGTLYSANLGDSGYLVIRNGKVVYPYDGFIRDSPEKADLASLNLMTGDIIVLATDGLWDNVSEEQIIQQLSGIKPGDLQRACNCLALTARRLAFDTQHLSPFAMKALKHGIDAPGGKPDDITLILLLIA
uniref:Protein phosphatase n=1 Tax=Gongylonema pulchrum TaxID=637853 RepID=A0A183E462_9BILA